MPYNYMSGGLANIGNLMGGMPMNGIKNPADFAMPEPSPAPAPAPVQQPQPQPQQPMQAAEEPFSEDLLNSDVGFATWAIKNGYMNNTGQMLKDDPTGGKRWKAGAKWMPNNVGLAMKALQGKKPTGKDSEAIRKMESEFFGEITRSLTPQAEQDPESLIPDELVAKGYNQGNWDAWQQILKDPKANKAALELATRMISPESTEAWTSTRKKENMVLDHARKSLKYIADLEDMLDNDGRLADINSLFSVVGWGNALKNLPNSKYKDFATQLHALQAQEVIKTLDELKAQSKTGATGFGALSEKELQLLLDSIGGLDQASSKELFTKNLGSLKGYLNDTIAKLDSRPSSPYARRNKNKKPSEDEWEDI